MKRFGILSFWVICACAMLPWRALADVDGAEAAAGQAPGILSDTSSSSSFIRGGGPEGGQSIETTENLATGDGATSPISINYTNIFYGPSVENPSAYQPASDGSQDVDRPVFTKNFLSASYTLADHIALTGTAYFHFQPVLGREFQMQDPFVRISHDSLISTDWGLNLYADARVHFPVTDYSRQSDMLTAFQNFNLLSWNIANSSTTVGVRTSQRYNIYGAQGSGVDVEFYVAPEAAYQLTDTLALTLLYEMGASHMYGDDPSFFTNDGTDLQPGVSWDVTPNLVVNPYLNLYTGGKITLASTSVGMFLSWTML